MRGQFNCNSYFCVSLLLPSHCITCVPGGFCDADMCQLRVHEFGEQVRTLGERTRHETTKKLITYRDDKKLCSRLFSDAQVGQDT